MSDEVKAKAGKIKGSSIRAANEKNKANLAGALKSQTARAVAGLKELVLRGDFRQGERIAEVPIATRLRVSRTPIRLALDRLAQEGLLEALETGGFAIRTYSVTEVWDAIELRAVIEGTAARLASDRLANSQELNILRSYANQMEYLAKNRDRDQHFEFFENYSELNMKFHAALIDIARSTILRRVWQQLQLVPFAGNSSMMLPDALELVLDAGLEHHHAILEAVEARDGSRAESIAREHARLGLKHLDFALRTPKSDPTLVRIDRGLAILI